MKFVDLHLSTTGFAHVLRERLKLQSVWCGALIGDGPFVVDRIEPSNDFMFENIPSGFTVSMTPDGTPMTFVRLKQALRIHLVTLNDLRQSGVNSAKPLVVVDNVKIHFDIRMSGSPVALCFEVSDVDLGSLESFVKEEDKADLLGSLIGQEQCIAFPLDKALGFFNNSSTGTGTSSPSIAHAGIRLISGSENAPAAIAIRIPAVAGFDDALWEEFYGGTAGDGLSQGDDWSMFVPVGLLEDRILGMFGDVGNSSDFSLQSGPSLSFYQGSPPALEVTFSGEVKDACACGFGPPFIWYIDVDVDVKANITFFVPNQDTLAIRANFSADPDDLEVICCAVTMTLLWPFVGPHFYHKGEINLVELYAGMIFFPAIFYVVIQKAYGEGPLKKLDQVPSQCTKESDEVLVCTSGLNLNNVVPGLALNRGNLISHKVGPLAPGGLRLSGTFTPPPALNMPNVVATVKPWYWQIPVTGCKQTGGIPDSYEARAHITMTNSAATPRAPFQSCMVKVLNGSATDNIFEPFVTAEQTTGVADLAYSIQISVPSSALTSNYLSNPYPLELLVISNGGARVITLPALTPPTPDQQEAAKLIWVQMTQAICDQQKVPYDEFFHTKIPKPEPDPVSEVDLVTQGFWQAVFAGLTDDASVTVSNAGGETLMVGLPSERGVVHLNGWRGPADADDLELLLHRPTKSANGGEAVLDQRIIPFARQIVLEDMGSSQYLSSGFYHGAPQIAIVHDAGLIVLDLSHLWFPTATAEILAEGIHGALFLGDEIVVWDEAGLGRIISEAGEIRLIDERISGEEILSVVRFQNRVFVLTNSSLNLFDRRLNLLLHMSLRGYQSLAPIQTGVVAGGEAGLLIARPGRAGIDIQPVPQIEEIDSVVTPLLMNARDQTIAVQWRRGINYQLFDLTDPAAPRQAGQYNTEPWFVRAVRVGSGFAFLAEGGAVEIYSPQGSLEPSAVPHSPADLG